MREDLLLRAGVGGVVTDHQRVEDRVGGQAPRARPIVGRRTEPAHFPLVPQRGHLVLHAAGERRHLPEPEELEDVDHVGVQGPPRVLDGLAQRPGEEAEQWASGDDEAAAVPRQRVAQRGSEPFHPGCPEDVLHPLERLAAPSFVEAERPREPKPEERSPEPGHFAQQEQAEPLPY